MDKYTEKIPLYLDNALSTAEAAEFETHLAACSACRTEHAALLRVEQMLAAAPVIAPPPDFAARFDIRLERRLSRRRTWIGATVISLVLTLAAGLLLWSVADYGLLLWGWLNSVNLLAGTLHLARSLSAVAGAVVEVGWLVIKAMLQLTRHPAFWGIAILTGGLVSLWVQMLRRLNVAYRPVVA
ncbi:MAG: zf-HC2 domain-containing protein [Anaerolineae bacterium]